MREHINEIILIAVTFVLLVIVIVALYLDRDNYIERIESQNAVKRQISEENLEQYFRSYFEGFILEEKEE